MEVAGTPVELELADVEIVSEDIPGWLVANEGNLTVALDITVTDELRSEGLARELVNRVQNIRKQSGFEVSDKVDVLLLSNDIMDKVVAEHHDYIAQQIQAESLEISDAVSDGVELDFDDFVLSIQVVKHQG